MIIFEMLCKLGGIILTFLKKGKELLKTVFEGFDSESQVTETGFPVDSDDVTTEEVETQTIDTQIMATPTLKAKLYQIEQKIEVFKEDLPEKYAEFNAEIERLHNLYDSYLEPSVSVLSITIDPEKSGEMNYAVSALERKVDVFIKGDFKFWQFAKRLQVLIVKLNVLYNKSITDPNKKEKVLAQVERGFDKLNLIKSEYVEYRSCLIKESAWTYNPCLSDSQLKERVKMLLRYSAYLIFKIGLRNSDVDPEILFCEMNENVIGGYFFEAEDVKALIEDEVSDLGELLEFVSDSKMRTHFRNQIVDLLLEISDDDWISRIWYRKFWDNVFAVESSLLEYLRANKLVDESKVKVKILVRMNVNVPEQEVVTSPKENAKLTFFSIYSVTQDRRMWLLNKLFENVSENVTYRQIYFICLLFDVMELINSRVNPLSRHLQKYIDKYPYQSDDVRRKKEQLLESSEPQQYVPAFKIDEDIYRVIDELESLKLDYEMSEEFVNINSFYFKGIGNIFNLVHTQLT